ncbi:MAG: hypothetical protein PHE68_03200 [Candidatus Peribacteraceae bacterium]|nr:hypothetical protein [Candidatus Peribacteraceae bacterium]MDD5074635.1 hypothetical protein [Candidatus Peribacteraceae bacterium]
MILPFSLHRHTTKALTLPQILATGVILLSTFILPSAAIAAEYLFFANDGTYPVNANALVLDFDDTGGNVTLQFGSSLAEYLKWNATTGRFETSDDLFVSNNLSASGALSVEGTANIKGATTLGSTLKINGVTYTFPASDGTASGKVLKTDGAGTLSWSDDNNSGGMAGAEAEGMFVNQGGDTMTGVLAIQKNAGTGTGNTLVVDTKGLVYDATNKRVGIGTAAPSQQLHVSGGDVRFDNPGVNNRWILFDPDQANIQLANNASADALYINRSIASTTLLGVGGGNVSIGDDSPDAHLEVSVNGTSGGNALLVSTDDGTDGDLLTLDETGKLGLGTKTPTTKLEVVGTMSGQVLHAQNEITSSGSLAVDGNAAMEGDLAINSDNGAADAVLTFGNDAAAETLKFNDTTNQFEFSDDVSIKGTMSGSTLRVDGNADVWGNLTVSGSSIIDGAATFGSTIKVNGVTYTFPASDGTASGKVLKTDSAGTLSWSDDNNSGGMAAAEAEGMFVNQGGDTMTGALKISDATGADAALEVRGIMSGKTLQVTGTGASPLIFADQTTERVGIGTATPGRKLDVIGNNGSDSDDFIAIFAENGITPEGSAVLNGTSADKALVVEGSGAAYFMGRDVTKDVEYMMGISTFSEAFVGSTTNHDLDFRTNNTRGRLHILKDGNVGIGITAPETKLEVAGTASGRILSFGDRLTGSGNVTIRTSTDSATAFQIFDQDGGNPVFNVDTTNERVGIGTAAPETALEVLGTMSGRSLRVTGSGAQPLIATNVSTGRVGIGIANPRSNFEVYGADGTTKVMITDYKGSPGSAATLQFGLNDGTFATTDAAEIVARSGLNPNMALDFKTYHSGLATDMTLLNGRLGIGSTNPESTLEVVGTMSGQVVHAEQRITSSGALAVEGAAAFGSTIKVNGVNYTFPFADGSASGKVLKTNGAGQLSWSADDSGTGLNQTSADARYVNTSGDTMTGALAIYKNAGTNTGNTLVVDTRGLVYDATNKRVGVGTSSPATIMDVTGTIRATTQTPPSEGQGAELFYWGNKGFVGAYDRTNTHYMPMLVFGSGISLIGTGNVGVGTSTAETKLEVLGTMSGKSLYVTGTGSSPLIVTDQSRGKVAIGEPKENIPSTVKLDVYGGRVRVISNNDTYGYAVQYGPSKGAMHFGATDSATPDAVFSNQLGVELMRLANGGNVGIGTTTPNTKLSVAGTASGRILSFGDRLTGSGAVSIRTLTDSINAFQVLDQDGGNPVFNIDTLNERVGIGTAAPETALEVTGTMSGKSLYVTGTGSSPLLDANQSRGKVSIGIANANTPSSVKLDVFGGRIRAVADDETYSFTAQYGAGKGQFYFGATNSATPDGVFSNVSGLEKMRITNDGYVGIGTASPTTKLEVVGTISGSQLRMGNATTSGSIIYSSGSTLMATAKGGSGQILVSKGTAAPQWGTPAVGLLWYIDGTLEIGANQGATVVMPYGFTCTGIKLRAKTAPTGANLIVDINKDGSTIFSTNPEIDSSATTEDGNQVFSVTDIPAGSVLTLDIDQVGSSTAGENLTVILNGTRKF